MLDIVDAVSDGRTRCVDLTTKRKRESFDRFSGRRRKRLFCSDAACVRFRNRTETSGPYRGSTLLTRVGRIERGRHEYNVGRNRRYHFGYSLEGYVEKLNNAASSTRNDILDPASCYDRKRLSSLRVLDFVVQQTIER